MIYWELFAAFFKVGLFAFGGGYASLPLIEAELLGHAWLSERVFFDLVTISQMTPGPIALNAASFTGYQLAGAVGAVVASLGFVTPSLLLSFLLAALYRRYGEHPCLRGCLRLLRPTVIVLIAMAAVRLVAAALELQTAAAWVWPEWRALLILVLSFLGLRSRRLKIPLLLLLSAGAGILLWGL